MKDLGLGLGTGMGLGLVHCKLSLRAIVETCIYQGRVVAYYELALCHTYG